MPLLTEKSSYKIVDVALSLQRWPPNKRSFLGVLVLHTQVLVHLILGWPCATNRMQ